MGFDVSALSEDLIDGAKIILSEYGLLDGAIRLEGVQGDTFLVESDGNSVRICYTRKVEFFRGLGYAIAKIGETFRISETCAFKEYGYMVDLSRNSQYERCNKFIARFGSQSDCSRRGCAASGLGR